MLYGLQYEATTTDQDQEWCQGKDSFTGGNDSDADNGDR